MKIPEDLKYTESDEWIRVEGDVATIGITDFAQDSLNDIVFVELKEVGEELSKGDPFGEVESVKASSEMYIAFDGEIIEVNDALEDDPEIINTDPYGEGWMLKVKIKDPKPLGDLMGPTEYAKYCEDR